MFEGIDSGAVEEQGKGRVAIAGGIAVAVLGALVLVIGVFGEKLGVRDSQEDEPVRVSFKAPAPPEPVVKKEPPPPPPKAKKRAKKRKAASAKPPSAPVEISDEALAEGSESDFASSIGGDGLGSLTEGTVGRGEQELPAPEPQEEEVPEPAPVPAPKPVFIADRGTRPRAMRNNPRPAFPEAERKRGREAVVVLRFLVTVDGRVTKISVVEGDEPFVAAAIAAVKRWQYIPASVDGRPSAAYHRIKIPFRLKS